MSIKTIVSGAGFALIHTATEAVVGILQVSLLWRFLPPASVGLWMIYLPIAGLFIAIAAAGSLAVCRQQAGICGIRDSLTNTMQFMSTSRRFFACAVLGNLVAGAALYEFYLSHRMGATSNEQFPALPWSLLVAAYSIRMIGFRYVGHLNGFGIVGKDKLLQAVCALILLASTYAFLESDLGLVGVGCAHLLSGIAFCSGAGWLLRREIKRHEFNSIATMQHFNTIALVREASGLVVMSVVAWLLTSTDVLMVEYLYGLESVSRYAALTKIVLLIAGLSALVPQMAFPFIASAWSGRRYDETRRLFRFSTWFAPILATLFCFFALGIAPYIIPIWLHSDLAYLGPAVFSAQLVFACIYAVHVSHVSAMLATGINPFVWAAIINAVLAMPIAFACAAQFGIVGIPLGYSLGTLPITIFVVMRTRSRFRTQYLKAS